MLLLPSQPGTTEPFAPSKNLQGYRELKLPGPPRRVRLGAMGMLLVAGELLGLAVYSTKLAPLVAPGLKTTPATMLFVFGIPIVLIAGAMFTVRMFRQGALIRTGAYSIGRVIFFRKSRSGLSRKKAIAYEFPVGRHKPMTGRGVDWTGKSSMDSSILVFYDPNDISRYVALCSTFWQVRTETGDFFRP